MIFSILLAIHYCYDFDYDSVDHFELCPLQSLPSFGPYLMEKKQVLADYKRASKNIDDINGIVIPTSDMRKNNIKKPVPAVKVRKIHTGSFVIMLSFTVFMISFNWSTLNC